jgi:hypothetical protein
MHSLIKILILGQSAKNDYNLRSYSKNIFQPSTNMPKTIPILIQYAYAKLVVSWDKPYWPEV